MATAARDRLARTLRGDAQTAFSVELKTSTDDLNLQVEGFGHVRFPVTPAKARKLLGLGEPARFGRGEQTLTDPDVRDTWEIPKHLVRAEWNDSALKDILATVKEELGLPNAAELTADLHSLLVYEQNQHFVAHQDSEKNDSMVGTLVATLPSSYAGGERGVLAEFLRARIPGRGRRGTAVGSQRGGGASLLAETGHSEYPRRSHTAVQHCRSHSRV